MKNIWVTSDLHFGDVNKAKKRNILDHDEVLCNNILNCISINDTLLILGDYILSKDAIKYAKRIREQCKKVVLVLGNHDTDTKERRKVLSLLLSNNLVDEVHSMYRKKNIIFSHAALHRKSFKGFNVHGHQHKKTCNKNRYYNVVPELNNYKPVRFQDIYKII